MSDRADATIGLAIAIASISLAGTCALVAGVSRWGGPTKSAIGQVRWDIGQCNVTRPQNELASSLFLNLLNKAMLRVGADQEDAYVLARLWIKLVQGLYKVFQTLVRGRASQEHDDLKIRDSRSFLSESRSNREGSNTFRSLPCGSLVPPNLD